MLSSILIALLWSCPEVQIRTLELDVGRSEILFSVTHMGFLSVEGTFSAFDANISLVNQQPASVNGNIKVRSIDTQEPARDETLLSKGYLDVVRFPNIAFHSTVITQELSGYTVVGKLKVKEEERTLAIPCEIITQDDQSIIITSQITIERSHFDLHFGAMNALIGDEIKVAVKLVFID